MATVQANIIMEAVALNSISKRYRVAVTTYNLSFQNHGGSGVRLEYTLWLQHDWQASQTLPPPGEWPQRICFHPESLYRRR